MVPSPGKFHMLVQALVGDTLSPDDAAAIIGIARLAVDADSTEDVHELAAYHVIATELCQRTGLDVLAVEEAERLKRRGPDERAQRMLSSAAAISTEGAKELAYACAELVAIADLAIQPVESQFLGDLQAALEISDHRHTAIAEAVSDATG